jgi:hypothetical protein
MNEKELVKKFKELFVEVNELKMAIENKKAVLEKTKHELLELMEADGKDRTATYEGIGFISRLKPRLYANITEERKPELFNFIREDGRQDLIKETVDPSSLSSYVSELLEQGKPVPECISYILKPSLRLYQKE